MPPEKARTIWSARSVSWNCSSSSELRRSRSRALWPKYVAAYQDALHKTSTKHAPWFIIPANHKWFRDLLIARIVVEHLEALKMQYPKSTVDLKCIRREYHAAEKDA